MKVIIVALFVISCIATSQALQCYSHEQCSSNCPQLANTIKTCTGTDNKCYKTASGVGVSRGCGKDRCDLQINANSIMANVCCGNDLCNTGTKTTTTATFGALLIALGVFFYGRM